MNVSEDTKKKLFPSKKGPSVVDKNKANDQKQRVNRRSQSVMDFLGPLDSPAGLRTFKEKMQVYSLCYLCTHVYYNMNK